MSPFHWFLVIVGLIVGGFAWAIYSLGLFRAMGAHVQDNVGEYAIGFSLIAISGLTTFTQTFSTLTAGDIATMKWTDWATKFALPIIAMLTTAVAVVRGAMKKKEEPKV